MLKLEVNERKTVHAGKSEDCENEHEIDHPAHECIFCVAPFVEPRVKQYNIYNKKQCEENEYARLYGKIVQHIHIMKDGAENCFDMRDVWGAEENPNDRDKCKGFCHLKSGSDEF